MRQKRAKKIGLPPAFGLGAWYTRDGRFSRYERAGNFNSKLNEQAVVSVAAQLGRTSSTIVQEIAQVLVDLFFSLGVMQNMVKCAHQLLMTRNSLLGIIFCSAAQSSAGKNMLCENGMT